MASNIFIAYFNPTWRPNYENIILSFSNILVYEYNACKLCVAPGKIFWKIISKLNELCDVITH